MKATKLKLNDKHERVRETEGRKERNNKEVKQTGMLYEMLIE